MTTKNATKTDILPILSSPPLKRKRGEVEDSQSEDEDLGSDVEFGWPNEEELATEGFIEEITTIEAIHGQSFDNVAG